MHQCVRASTAEGACELGLTDADLGVVRQGPASTWGWSECSECSERGPGEWAEKWTGLWVMLLSGGGWDVGWLGVLIVVQCGAAVVFRC